MQAFNTINTLCEIHVCGTALPDKVVLHPKVRTMQHLFMWLQNTV